MDAQVEVTKVEGAKNKEKWRGRFSWPPVAIVVVVHILALCALPFFSWRNVGAFLISHFLVGCLGTVIGLHRYFSHRSFYCPAWFEILLGFLGTLSFQQGPITWAMYHRAHHRFTENEGDPHSASRGFMWSHMLWLFYIAPNGFRKNSVSVKDLMRSKWLVFFDRHHLLVNIVTPIIFYLATRDLGMTLWVFPLRTVVFWHSTWAVNSYVHRATWREGPSGIIRNSLLMTLLVYGDGWHFNHHQYPALARAGLLPFQIDPAYWLLLSLKYMKIIRFSRNL
ncbi:MAG: acyl-CoA desaturase [Bdellovibrionales bacterium]